VKNSESKYCRKACSEQLSQAALLASFEGNRRLDWAGDAPVIGEREKLALKLVGPVPGSSTEPCCTTDIHLFIGNSIITVMVCCCVGGKHAVSCTMYQIRMKQSDR